MTVLIFTLLGLGSGSMLALLAVGLTLIFRASGVVNMAQGGFAMFAAFLYMALRNHGFAIVPAIVVALAAIGLIGLATDQLLLRRLRNASSLTRFIATLGMLLLLDAVAQKIWGTTTYNITTIIPSHPIHLGNSALPSDRLWLLGIAVCITAALTLIWRHTRIGWIAEAVSENERLASTLGWSPAVVSGLTWSIGAVLAGLCGILIAPIIELNVTVMPLLVVPALAAALIGGFRSFPVTLLAALAIGAAQSLITEYVPVTGAADAVPFIVIAILLSFRGSALPIRGFAAERLPRIGTGQVRWRVVVPATVAVVAGLSVIASADWLTALTTTFAVAIILLSFVLLIGYAGQVSLAQWALAGFGVLFAGRLMFNLGLPFWLAFLLGTIGAGLVGLIFALPALRTRGVNLAIVTLGLAVAANSVIFSNASIVGGLGGLTLPPLSLFGWSVDPIAHAGRYAVLTFLVFVVAALIVARTRTTTAGRMMLAVRDNERAAASNGISVLVGKVIAFALAGAIAGAGGIMLAFEQPILIFQGYDPLTAVGFLADAVIGGVGFLLGTVFGALFYPGSFGSIIALHWQSFNDWIPLIGAVGLLITLLLNPNGWVYEVLKPLRRLVRLGLFEASPRPRRTRVTPKQEAQESRAVPLTLEGITVRYGGNVAVDAVSLNVQPGQIVGLIGPNGAGKTSLIDGITGFTAVAGGKVALGPDDITQWAAHRRARLGLTRSFQTLELYRDMTVRENILTAVEDNGFRAAFAAMWRRRRRELGPTVQDIVRELRLDGVMDRLPEELSYGQRRLLAIARALAMGPSVLLIDEPVSGLDETESTEIVQVLQSLARSRRIGILVVEHDMAFVMALCDWIYVIDFGRSVTQGPPAAIREDPTAIAAYLGEEVEEVEASAATDGSMAGA